MPRITIKRSTKNIGLHYIISKNGRPILFENTKAEANKTANKLRRRALSKRC